MATLIDVILHLDKYLNIIIQNYGLWAYVLLFIIIFCETGLVFTPFLPGDSILFAAGALASIGTIHIFTLFLIVFLGAVIGDTVNYTVGNILGNHIINRPSKLINKNHILKAQTFYDNHGSMTIVLGRFIPIIRTFVPFVAGLGNMKYYKFILNNILGGFMWVTLMVGLGYFFGELPFIKQHFSLIVVFIIIISIIPGVITILKEHPFRTKSK